MNEPPTITVTLPRTLLEDAFTIVVLAQQRRDYLCNEAGREFPSHTLMEFINASEAIKKANVIEVEDAVPKPTIEVPWEEDSMKNPVKSPCAEEADASQLPPEVALEKGDGIE